MKILKTLLIVTIVLIGIYSIWMTILPDDYEVSRSEIINVKRELVYATVSDLKTWPEWGIWFQKDSTTTTWGDQTQGAGASYSWDSNSGSGTQSIVDVTENEELKTHINFNCKWCDSDGYWRFEEVKGGKTKVTWSFAGSFPFFFRIFEMGMEKRVGPDFEQSLANLKEMLESMPEEEDMEIIMIDAEPAEYYSITDEVPFKDMGADFFGQRYREISEYLGEDMKSMTGAPFAIYHKWDMENEIAIVEVAMPVHSQKTSSDRVKKDTSYSGKALKAVYMGPYEGIEEVHYAMDDYIKENNLEISGAPWEVYVTDPTNEPDTSKWTTEIYYPVIVSQSGEVKQSL